jgi:hypothetical protein
MWDEVKNYWEDVENLLGTSWNTLGTKKSNTLTLPQLKIKSGHLDACSLNSLPATKKFASLYSLPFLA